MAAVPRRRLGRLGFEVRPVGLGGAWLRGRKHEKSLEEGAELVLAAVELGVDYLDTSIRYGDSELVIGRALAQLPAARHPRIATKSDVIPEGRDTAQGVFDSCRRSLDRLGLARVDVLQLHEAECYGFDRIMAPGGALDGLRRARQAGYCLGIGVTGRPPDLLARLLDTGAFDTVLTYFEYDLATAAATRELLPAAVRHDVGVIAGSPVRMGMFAGDGLLSKWDRQPEEIRAMRPRLEAIFGRPAHEMADLAVRYLYSDPRVHQISVGSSQLASLASSIRAAAEGPLPAEQLALVREAQGWRG
jgi:aryl-alcohol dehydrogenase-like predicted oxidoreductase